MILRLWELVNDFVTRQALGVVTADVWFEIAPGIVRAPDVAFFPAARWKNINPKQALRALPALAVEVLSGWTKTAELSRKIQQYLSADISEVWVIDPDTREVDLYRLGRSPRKLRDDDPLESAELPGFSLPLSRLFE